MKKIIFTAAVAFIASLTINSVSAQSRHYEGRGHIKNSSAHTYTSSRRVAAYNNHNNSHYNYNNRSNNNHYYNNNHNYGSVAHVSHYYNNRRPVFAGRRRVVVPWGAAHRYAYARPVYFPAYHLYYDPYRCGYTYWSGGRWLFSVALPSIFAGINLAAANMAYLDNVPQAAYYPDGYNDGYYAQPVAPVVAAPGVSLNIHIGL
ncbi:hypothetical protein A9P82_05240 [Arachidicoccus ginsenosidimutans]|uniref:hypothetical protein n=1 Tax=Arachidicoccus sp. BS20 TaxID=1850526 RepID=UPI0007F0D7E1|nr:hypothetical protein [Arachidicoccus sp. BS20]ANI88740.1 hypothetical protein A9P82_05240 [Arachidicoccus sp. BS20]